MKKIYYNGDFITLENNNIEAIFIEDGIIKATGKKEDILKNKDNMTEIIDLKGHTMMPSFIDAHSHFSGVATNFLKVNLENCSNFKQIQEELKIYKEDNNIVDGKWILAHGYDHNNLDEKAHPKKEIIDEVLPNNPVILEHKSGHVGVFNSKALKELNISNNTIAKDGGFIEKINGDLTGYMEENSFLEYQKQVPMPKIEELLKAYEKAQYKYLSYGITTAQDGMTYSSLIPIYENLISNDILNIDLVSYIEVKNKEIFFNTFKNSIKQYYKHFKIGGYKIFLDGSPQGKTAWMRTPYIDDKNYFGYGTMKDSDVKLSVKAAIDSNLQLLAHCNGDKAAEQYINSIEKHKNDIKSLRPVMIHAQLLGIDQIEYLKKYNIIPSFFVSHVFYYGDIHIKNFGYERASNISPTNSTLKENVIFTLHQDSPVIEPNMFETIWIATCRLTKSGKLLGKDERIPVIDAIKSVTINSAYQYFEEDKKGSIKEGKLADLIIIDKNPLKINVDDIRNIKILETIKNGNTLYKKNIEKL